VFARLKKLSVILLGSVKDDSTLDFYGFHQLDKLFLPSLAKFT
jgi:hypothetical protein